LGAVDEQIAKEAKKAFDKQGLKIELGVKVGEIVNGKKGVTVNYTNAKGEAVVLDADKLIISIGRVPNTIGLNTEAVGLKLDERGFVLVDGDCKTSLPNVWAVGDVVRGPMLAHKGFEEGIAVAELIAGLPGHVNFDTIPWVIYTEPEIAWVGKTEEQLKAEGVPYKTGTFPFAAVGRAVAMAEPAGFVKVIAHEETDTVLGLHLVGANVSELVHEGVLTMEFKGSADDLARICHAHPSMSEAVHDAAMAVHKRAIHKVN
jgi:dihydrolipoamide dehydrogenase